MVVVNPNANTNAGDDSSLHDILAQAVADNFGEQEPEEILDEQERC